MDKHYGWTEMVVFGKPLKINRRRVFYHSGRDECAIECDDRYLVQLSDAEQAILDAFLQHEIEAGWAEDNAELAAKEAGR